LPSCHSACAEIAVWLVVLGSAVQLPFKMITHRDGNWCLTVSSHHGV
jgi:hypothetical protein